MTVLPAAAGLPAMTVSAAAGLSAMTVPAAAGLSAMTVPAAAGLSLRFAVSAYFLNSNGNEAIFLPSAPLKMLQVPVTVLTGKKSRSLSIFSSAEKSAFT